MDEPKRPCNWKVEENNQIFYCEVGPYGHDSSHIGAKSPADYWRELRNWRAYERQRKADETEGT